MSELRAAEAATILEFVGNAMEVDGPAQFTTELLDRLAELMRCDYATWLDLSLVDRTYDYLPCSRDLTPVPAVKWSDSFSSAKRRRFETTPWASSIAVIDCIWTMIEIDRFERGHLILHSRDRDFTERDRRILAGLGPHLRALSLQARARRRLASLATPSLPPDALTARETEVLHHIAAGASTAQIARALWVTPATVSKHLEHIYRKLDVPSRTAALAAAGLSRTQKEEEGPRARA